MAREDGGRDDRASLYATLDLIYVFVSEQIAFLAIGWALDRYAGTGPWGLAGFGFFGTWVSLYHLLQRSKAAQDRRSPPPSESSPPPHAS